MKQRPTLAHLGYLDGLRGLAAFWVMLGHIFAVYGQYPKIISWTSLPVDVFIILSGFLMTHQTLGREVREPIAKPRTWLRFWVRRVFRIAPLYYVMLLCVLIVDQALRGFDGSFSYATWHGEMVAKHQFAYYLMSHLSFIYGLFPEFHRTDALPDWTLSLEMQFYALFPFLMIVGRRMGWLVLWAVICGIAMSSDLIFANYLGQFTLPSIIVLKLHVFMAGMLTALGCQYPQRRYIYALIAAGGMLLPLHGFSGVRLSIDRALICAAFSILAYCNSESGRTQNFAIAGISNILASLPLKVMGDLSYGVYLIHYPVVLLWTFFVVPHLHMGVLNHSLPAIIIISVISYALAWLLRRLVELPGIALGRRIVRGVFAY